MVFADRCSHTPVTAPPFLRDSVLISLPSPPPRRSNYQKSMLALNFQKRAASTEVGVNQVVLVGEYVWL